MVKSVLSSNYQGLRDWVVQRVTAIIMAIYAVGLAVYLLVHPSLSFAEWHHLFSINSMKIATILAIVCVLKHAWVGMRTVFTDYIKCTILRGILNVVVWVGLFACFFWALLILWSV